MLIVYVFKSQHFIEVEKMSVDSQDENGYSPLYVRFYMREFLNINCHHRHAAAAWNHVDLARYLIEKGANVNIRDSDGDTPLHHCEKVSMATLLIDAGADYRLENDEGQKPLDVAVEDENEKLSEYLKNLEE